MPTPAPQKVITLKHKVADYIGDISGQAFQLHPQFDGWFIKSFTANTLPDIEKQGAFIQVVTLLLEKAQ